MSKQITPAQLELIVHAINNWKPASPDEKFNWNVVITIAETITCNTYTRAALDRHDDIKTAYTNKKEHRVVSKETVRIHKLEGQLEELEKTNAELSEKFLRWSYNAAKATPRGLTEEDLEEPIPTKTLEKKNG